ncbi:hypothetical protein BCF74_1253 [Knoellia remsis]|uniref:Integral membrane protein n=1 Tax=Knoellia remsis TaxID=407159 RepID=A0A2T0U852_9MICO|nr:hypothetical protein [Knoellia remsis]PRY54094.1 hypothetical protein BCF74_1253 [Knoellia remsis]
MIEARHGVVRALRASVLSVLILALGSAAHAMAGGHVPPPIPLVLLAVLVWPACLALTSRRLGGLSAGAALALGQVATHLGLTAMTLPGATGVSAGSAPAMSAADHAAMSGGPVLTGAASVAGTTGTTGMEGMAHGLTGSMLAWHAVATVLLALLVRHGERVLWAVVARALPQIASARIPALLRVAVRPAALTWASTVVAAATRPRAPPHVARAVAT